MKQKSKRLKKFLGKKMGKTVSKLKSVADEYLHGEEVASDDEEMTAEMIRTGIKVLFCFLVFAKPRLLHNSVSEKVVSSLML